MKYILSTLAMLALVGGLQAGTVEGTNEVKIVSKTPVVASTDNAWQLICVPVCALNVMGGANANVTLGALLPPANYGGAQVYEANGTGEPIYKCVTDSDKWLKGDSTEDVSNSVSFAPGTALWLKKANTENSVFCGNKNEEGVIAKPTTSGAILATGNANTAEILLSTIVGANGDQIFQMKSGSADYTVYYYNGTAWADPFTGAAVTGAKLVPAEGVFYFKAN